VRAIAQDRGGRLWFGTTAGASRYDGQAFRTFTTKDGLADDYVQTIAQDRGGRLWFGTNGGGASRYDGQSFKTFTTEDGLGDDTVLTIAQDRKGCLWFGTYGGGASRYNFESFRTFGIKDGLAADDVSAITQDRDGALWFGTGRGASRYDRGSFRTFTTKDGLADDDVRAIAQDREGQLWFGTTGGASRYHGQSFRTFTTKDGLAADNVQTITQDREGRLWFGTYRGGASRYDGKSFQTFTTKDGLAGDAVLTIAQDREGRLWFGTYGGGASRYDGESFRTFTTKDGLADDDVRAIAQDREGRLWFGTRKGVSVYAETEVVSSVSRRVLLLTLSSRLISDGPQPREVLWSYRLDDQLTWSEPSSSAWIARDYFRLRSGKHVLRIRAWDGKVNPPRTTVYPFEVSGAEQSIAFAAYLVLVGAPIGVGLYWLGKRQTVRSAVKLHFNPYRAGLPVGPDLFTGREDLLKKVTAELANHCVLVTGERRIGKTSFLHALGRQLTQIDEPSWRWVPCYASLEGVADDQFFAVLVSRLLENVRKDLPPDASLHYATEPNSGVNPYGIEPFRSDLKAITHSLDAAAKKPVRLVFLIDEVDALNAYSNQVKYQLRSVFQGGNLAERVRTVMAGVHLDLEGPPEFSPPFNYLYPFTMRPFTPEEARSLIVAPVRGFYRYEPAAVERITALSEGRPLVIQAFGLRLVERILDEKRRTVVLEDVESVQLRVIKEVGLMLKPESASPPHTAPVRGPFEEG
jgi:streptogramin lyase